MIRMARPQPGTFGSRLWECLEDDGVLLTQAAIAKYLQVSGPTARDYLYGGALPRMKKLRDIAAVLRVSVDWLWDGSGLKRPQVTTRIATIASILEPWLMERGWNLLPNERASVYEYLLTELEGTDISPAQVHRKLDAIRRLGVLSAESKRAK